MVQDNDLSESLLQMSSALTVIPGELTDLFDVFPRLERGESVALGATEVGSTRTEAPPDGPALGVYSSGSTGRPKLVWRRWSELRSGAKLSTEVSGWTWASPFRPESFAGVQVALQAWRTNGSLVSLGNDWENNWAILEESRPQALSCTPTFLDLLLQFEKESTWTPKQVTLGGEVLRPGSGQRFRARFPETRFTVIYAAAEHGVLLKTHRLDGWYECGSLGHSGKFWRVQERLLELWRDGQWVSTGDWAELVGDLIRIAGRADAVVNVGGVKVNLDEVSYLAEQVPGVRRAIAVALPSPVVGQIIGLRFALEPNQNGQVVQDSLQAHLRAHLRKEAWPRHWEVDAVGLGSNSKRAR